MKQSMLLLALLIAAILASCGKEGNYTHAVYIWDDRNEYNFFSALEEEAIFKNDIRKIYCKLSDVVWNETYHAEPTDIHEMPFDHTLSKYAEIVPCMFFTNEVMIHSSTDELDYMAQKIADRVNNYDIKEFQVDCDWSESSKENYFHFITTLKSKLDSGIQVSATIRLYQYKYPEKAGVPPADRGMLMLYNFNSPKLYDGTNAIFDENEAKKYLSLKSYQLPLDFAIAHYRWYVLYDGSNNFIGFVSEVDSDRIRENVTTVKAGVEYELTSDVSIGGYFARKGHKLVIHSTDAKTIDQSLEIIEDLANSESYSVTLFDLNRLTLEYLLSDESRFEKSID